MSITSAAPFAVDVATVDSRAQARVLGSIPSFCAMLNVGYIRSTHSSTISGTVGGAKRSPGRRHGLIVIRSFWI